MLQRSTIASLSCQAGADGALKAWLVEVPSLSLSLILRVQPVPPTSKTRSIQSGLSWLSQVSLIFTSSNYIFGFILLLSVSAVNVRDFTVEITHSYHGERE